jgi:hypothetical protein
MHVLLIAEAGVPEGAYAEIADKMTALMREAKGFVCPAGRRRLSSSTPCPRSTSARRPPRRPSGSWLGSPGRSRLFDNSADEYLQVHDQGPVRPTSRRARAASGEGFES